MKYIAAFLIIILAGGIYIYNTTRFQALFKDDFYDDICYMPFDVTKKDEKISIPLKYKYKTCYRLCIAVPDKNIAVKRISGPGVLNYRFVSNGRVLADGRTFEPNRRSLSFYLGISTIHILVFNLPFPGAGDDLTLELEVLEPMTFLEPYAGKIYCKINPDYNPKFCECYNKKLMIPQQAAGN